MKCLQCDKEEFAVRDIHFSPEIKGESVDVVVPCTVCIGCETPVMDAKQMNALRRAAADRYRTLHGLLTSSEIRSYREALGMSQSAFANYLKVGEASIKRWETYYIQDASQDEHIRLKCDESYAETNFLNIQWTHQEADQTSGWKKFSFEHFKQVALYLIKTTKVDLLFLNKLHFYVDFLHYKQTGTSLTGARYVPLKLGPCPDQYQMLYDSLESQGLIKRRGNHGYSLLQEPDLSSLNEEEKQTLKTIAKALKQKGKNAILDLSHEERAFIETDEGAFISYDYAKDLKI